MIQIVIAAAVALLLGAFATEIQSRLFAGQYFATLVMTVLGSLPQAAILIGAGLAAVVSYNGHRVFSFAAAHAPVLRDHQNT